MDISDIDRTLCNLQEKVNGFGVYKKTEYQPNFKFDFKSPLILFGSVPIVLLIILCVWRPRLVTVKVKEDIYGEPPIYSLSPKKVIFAVVLLSACIAGVFIVWNKYIKKSLTV
jgi:hypothetical protein